ncbi:MAG: protein kinase, partial [Planctomycetota bacterium]|nr:protein kinase [Planctomycetota bacterium]
MSEVCLALEEKLIAFVDDELESPVEKALITDHVGRCDHCRKIVQDLQGVGLAVHEFFDALGRGPVSEELAQAAPQASIPIPPPPNIPLAQAGAAGSGPVAPAVPVANNSPTQASGPTKAWGYLQNNASPATPDIATGSNSWGRGWGAAAATPPAQIPATPMPAASTPAPPIPPTPTPAQPVQKSKPIPPPPPTPLPSEPDTVVLSPAPPMTPPSGPFQSSAAPSKTRSPSASLLSAVPANAPGEDFVTDLAELVGGQLGGYRVVREIAHGGMGTVFHAIQISMDRPIALKVLAPRLQTDEVFVRRFAREARAAAQLDHPNLVRIYDVGQERGCSFYSMELITGNDLKEILKEKVSLPIEQCLKLAVQSCKAMEMALKHGIVHRDIKPANILIEDKTGDVKIADLGLAKENGASGDGAITMDKTVMGSPNYMSPEQAEDVRIADHQSDVYALGATLYHMATGIAPYGKGKPVEILARMLTTDLELPDPIDGPPIDPALRKIIHRAMAKKRENRYADAKSLRLDLEMYWKSYKAKPASSNGVPDSGDLMRSGVGRSRVVKGRGSRRSYDGPVAKPSRLLMLLSSVLGFVVIALLCQLFIKVPINDTPITDNKDAPKKDAVKTNEKIDKGKSAEDFAKDRKAEEARRVRFAQLIEDLKNPKKDYKVAFAGIKKIGDLTLDKDLEDKIERVISAEESLAQRLEGLIGECDSLKKNFVDDPEHLIRVKKKSLKLAKELSYHPLSETLLTKVEVMKDLQKQ